MTRHAYTGEQAPWFLPTPVFEGWLDARRASTRREPNLYRRSLGKRLLWEIGRARIAVNGFPKAARRVSPVYSTGIHNWDTDRNYSLVLGTFRVIATVDKRGCGDCCAPTRREAGE